MADAKQSQAEGEEEDSEGEEEEGEGEDEDEQQTVETGSDEGPQLGRLINELLLQEFWDAELGSVIRRLLLNR